MKCYNCEKFGHIARRCPEERRQRSPEERRRRSPTPGPGTRQEAKSNYIRVMNVKAEDDCEATPLARVDIVNEEGKKFRCEICPDTGSSQSIIAKNLVDKYDMFMLQKKKKIMVANNGRMNCLGSVNFEVEYEGEKTTCQALVSLDLHDEVLIDWRTLQRLRMIPQDFPRVIPRISKCQSTKSEGLASRGPKSHGRRKSDGLASRDPRSWGRRQRTENGLSCGRRQKTENRLSCGRRQKNKNVALLSTNDRIPDQVRDHGIQREEMLGKVKEDVDPGRHALSRLAEGSRVIIQDPKTKCWTTEGVVLGSRKNRSSYWIEADGKRYLRDRKTLRPLDTCVVKFDDEESVIRTLNTTSGVQDTCLEQDEESIVEPEKATVPVLSHLFDHSGTSSQYGSDGQYNTCLACCRTWKDCSCYEEVKVQDKENVIKDEEIVRVEKTTVPYHVFPTISDGCYFGLPIGH